MKKGDVHYIVFYNDCSIESLTSINNSYRKDIKLIIKRTFIKRSSGQGLYEYHKNQILNEKRKVVRSNNFKWNQLKCKIKTPEHWGEIRKGFAARSVVLDIQVKDHLNKQAILRYNVARKDVFNLIMKDLSMLDRVATHQGFREIKALQEKVKSLEEKLKRKKKL